MGMTDVWDVRNIWNHDTDKEHRLNFDTVAGTTMRQVSGHPSSPSGLHLAHNIFRKWPIHSQFSILRLR